jgi:hypothetical protein
MTGKHYAWHKRWAVDLATRTATHETGLVARFSEASDDLGGWSGELVQPAANAVLRDLVAKHGGHNAPKMIARLAREAGEVYHHATTHSNN